MKIGFNGLNRCFDFGLVGPFRPKRTQADPLGPSGLFRPKQTLYTPWNRNWPFGLVGGGAVGGWEALPYKGGLPQGSLVAQNLVDEGGDIA